MIYYLKNTELDDHVQVADSIILVDIMERAKGRLEMDGPYVIDSHKQIDSIIMNFLGFIAQFLLQFKLRYIINLINRGTLLGYTYITCFDFMVCSAIKSST